MTYVYTALHNYIHRHSSLVKWQFFHVGFLVAYIPSQSCVWGTLLSVFLFWGVVFPYSFRRFKSSKKVHYAHVVSVVLGIVLPLMPGLAHLGDGHVVFIAPPITCLGRNPDFTFYTYVLPVNVALAISSCLLVLTFWNILKVSV